MLTFDKEFTAFEVTPIIKNQQLNSIETLSAILMEMLEIESHSNR